MPRIRITVEAARLLRKTGTIEFDMSDEVIDKLVRDPKEADTWIRYTVAPLISEWKEVPRPPATMGIDAEVTAAKWEKVE